MIRIPFNFIVDRIKTCLRCLRDLFTPFAVIELIQHLAILTRTGRHQFLRLAGISQIGLADRRTEGRICLIDGIEIGDLLA